MQQQKQRGNVLLFQEHIWFNEFVQPVCLPGKRDPLYAEERCWVVGWGDTLRELLFLGNICIALVSIY